MLILIEGSEWIDEKQGDVRDGIENLLRAGASGCHFIAISYEAIKAIRSWESLSVQAYGELKRAANERSERLGVAKRSSLCLRINGYGVAIEKTFTSTSLTDGVELFAKNSETREVYLVVENLADMYVYRPAIEYGVSCFAGGLAKSRFEPVPGGGSTTAQVVRAYAQRRSLGWVVAITDSDCSSPDNSCGMVAHNVGETIQVLKNEGWYLVDQVITDGRSVENYIPTGLWCEVLNRVEGRRYTRAERRIRKIQESVRDVWKYVDWKKGTRVGEHIKLTSQGVSYWRGVLNAGGRCFWDQCRSNVCCYWGDNGECKCVINEKMSVTPIQKIEEGSEKWVEKCIKNGEENIEERREALCRLGSDVAIWCIANQPLRT
jgi:hypothetical protein